MSNTFLNSRYLETLRCLSQICFRYENPECFHINSLQCKHLCDALKGLSAVLCNLSNAYPNAWKEIFRAVKEAEIYLQHCSTGEWPIQFLTRSTTGEAYSLHLHDVGLCRLLLDVILRTDTGEICRKFSHFDEEMARFKRIRQEFDDEVQLIKTCEQFAERSTHTTEDKNIVEVSKFLGGKLKGTISIPVSTEVDSSGAETPIPAWLEIDPADLVLESEIGEGSFGRVYEGSWQGLRVAAKEMSMEWRDVFEAEASILAKLQSPFIVHLIGTCIKDFRLYLVMEMVSSNLEQFLESRFNGDRPPLVLPVAVDIMLQISRAMEYLHSQGIMHLDLKASNVLFEVSSVPESREGGYGRAKLCDFGTASPRLFSFRASDPKGTSNWRAPEVFPRPCEDLCAETISPEKYTSKADVYSFAMTCYQILTGKQPFPGLQAREIYTKIVKGERPTIESSICPFILANYIQQCWDTDPDHRPCFEAVSKFLRKLKLCILKSPFDWKDALNRGFYQDFGFVDNDNESIFSLKRGKWEKTNLVAMHNRLDEMLFIWRFLSLEMRREIAIDIASFLARIHGNSEKEFLDLCLHGNSAKEVLDLCLDSSTIYLDWKLKPIFSGVASGKPLHRRGKKTKQSKQVDEFKDIRDFGGILVELSTGCTSKDMPFSIASIQRQIEDLLPEFVDRQLVEEMEKLGKRQLWEVVRWCKLGLWCLSGSPSQPPNIHTVLQLLKQSAPIDLRYSTLRDYLSSIPTIELVRDLSCPNVDLYPPVSVSAPTGKDMQTPVSVSAPTKTTVSLSAPTKNEVIKSFKAVSNTTDLNEFVGIIKQVLEEKMWNKRNTTGKEKAGIWTSFTRSGAKYLYFVNDHTPTIQDKKDIINFGNSIVIAKILDKIGKNHWVVGGLVLAAFLIEKSQEVSANKAQALELLTNMVDLATALNKLKDLILKEEEKFKKAVMLVVQGSIIFVSQIHSQKCFSFLKTIFNSENLIDMSVRLDLINKDLTLATTAKTSKPHSKLLPVLKPQYPKYAVGIENAQEHVIELLDTTPEDESKLVVVIFGSGGKTTLATAVVAMLDLDAYNYAAVQFDENMTKNDLKEIQKVILKYAFPSFHMGATIELTDCQDGRDRLREAFKCVENKPMFLFMDNIVTGEYLKELFPEDLRYLPKNSRILLTTRKLDRTDIFLVSGITRRSFAVRTLRKPIWNGSRLTWEGPCESAAENCC